MLIPPSGYTTMNGCFKALKDHAKQMVAEGKITDYSIFPVQPWLDIPEITSRVITIGEDAERTIECANILAQELFDLREEAETNLTSVDEIITIAEENKSGKPVLLAEASDSPGGGCPGDSPVVALKIQERGSTIRACMDVIDPAAVEKAFDLGVGGTGEFAVGACYTKDMPGPFRAEGTVRSLHDGWFRTSKFGYNYIGRAAVVRFGNIDILLHCRGAASGQPQLMRQFGMEPLHYDLVVIKANTSFRASYQTISDLIYVADTPGAGAANLKRFRWQHLPKGLYPFETPQGPTPAKLK
jgi:microcystin degradation protein MlrC